MTNVDVTFQQSLELQKPVKTSDTAVNNKIAAVGVM